VQQGEFNSSNQEILDILRQLYKGVRKYGVKKILAEIKNLSDKDDKYFDKIFDYIIDICCWHFDISGVDFFSNFTGGNLNTARKISLDIALQHNKDISFESLSKKYNKTRQTIHKWHREVKTYERSNKVDCKLYFAHYDVINDKLTLILQQTKDYGKEEERD
jgi:hypothetical protein